MNFQHPLESRIFLIMRIRLMGAMEEEPLVSVFRNLPTP